MKYLRPYRQAIPALIASIAICEFAGILGSLFTFSSVQSWYASLVKPALNPPGWIFGPVWTTLYALMGVAAFFIWQKGRSMARRHALKLFAIQLVLNALWSILFFGRQSPGLAFLDIIALWVMIIWTMLVFYRLSRPAAYLLVPYVLWVSFATYLNGAIWYLNP